MARRLALTVAILVGVSALPGVANAAETVSLVRGEEPGWVLFRMALTGTSGKLIVQLNQPSGAYMHVGFYDDQLRWSASVAGIQGYSGTRVSVQGDDLTASPARKGHSFGIHVLLSPEGLDGRTEYVLLGASGDFESWNASLEVDGEIRKLERIAEGASAHYVTYHDLDSPTSVSASYRGPGAMAIVNGTWSTQLEGAAVGSMQFYWGTLAAATESTNVVHGQEDAVERYECPCWFRELQGPGSLAEGTLQIDATRVAVVERNTWEWTAAAFFDVVLPEDLLASVR